MCVFGFLGVGNPSLWVLDSDMNPRLIHEFKTNGNLTTTHIRHAVLPIKFEAADDMRIDVGSIHAANLGKGNVINKRNFAKEHTINIPINTTEQVVAYQSLSTFEYEAGSSTTNKKKSRLLSVQFFIEAPATGSGQVTFRIGLGTVVGGTSILASQYNSVMEYYEDGTQTLITPSIIFTGAYAGSGGGGADLGGQIEVDAEKLDLVAYAGDVFVIEAQNSGAGGGTGAAVNVHVNLEWEEF